MKIKNVLSTGVILGGLLCFISYFDHASDLAPEESKANPTWLTPSYREQAMSSIPEPEDHSTGEKPYFIENGTIILEGVEAGPITSDYILFRKKLTAKDLGPTPRSYKDSIPNIYGRYAIAAAKALYFYEKYNQLRPGEVLAWIWWDKYVYQPVVYTPGNPLEYVDKNIYREKSHSGIPIMLPESEGNFEGNSIIYGHNMLDETAFGGLYHLHDQEVFDNSSPLILINSIEKRVDIYLPFTIFSLDAEEEILGSKNFQSEKHRRIYNEYLRNRSIVTPDPNLNLANEVLLLQTNDLTTSQSSRKFVYGLSRIASIDWGALPNYQPSSKER